MFLVKRNTFLRRRHPRQKVVIRFAVLHAELPRRMRTLTERAPVRPRVSCGIVPGMLFMSSFWKYAEVLPQRVRLLSGDGAVLYSIVVRRFPLLKPRVTIRSPGAVSRCPARFFRCAGFPAPGAELML